MSYWAFPSPCGDMVLKLEVLFTVSLYNFKVSVPLRGYGFEMFFSISLLRDSISIVSVPLRGYGFEMGYRRKTL